jgi:hypothetical protein
MSNFWESFWMVILGVFCILLMVIMAWFFFAEKPTVRYDLSPISTSGGLQIRVDIENACDEYIPLIGVDYERAIAIKVR